MTDQEMLRHIARYGYGVYKVGSKFAVADPVSDKDGYYLETDTVAEMFKAMQELELLYGAP